MDDPRWLRIVVVGLILAILAVIYFLLTGGLSGNKNNNIQTQGTQTSKVVVPIVTMSPQPQKSATPSAYNTIANRSQGSAQTLPRTGFPFGLVVVISASAVGTGLALRKFPR